jgi:hypothetical protein
MHVDFDTTDSGDRVGRRIELGTGLVRGQGKMYYYDTVSSGRPWITYATIVPNARPDSVHARLLEARDLDLSDEQTTWLVRKFTFEVLMLTEGDISPGAEQLLGELLQNQQIRARFYDPSSRPALLESHGVTGAERTRFLEVDSEVAEAWLTAIDLGHGARDRNLYLLFVVGPAGLPDPRWLAATYGYLEKFAANVGFYTSEAVVYQRVLVVAEQSLASLTARTVRFLRLQGADARPLVAHDIDELFLRLKERIDQGEPLPELD